MNKLKQLFCSMFKIGLIGFGGGNALIPVIEKTVIDEQKLIDREEYDIDVMVASITPGALPVEISAGIGRRILGKNGLILGAVAMALPGTLLTLLLLLLMRGINSSFVEQIGFLSIGIYAFIGTLLTKYIVGTVKDNNGERSNYKCIAVIVGVTILVCGQNLYRILPGGYESLLSLNTIQVFAMSFFVILYTRCRLNYRNVLVASLLIVMFVLCNCKSAIIGNNYIRYIDYVLMIVLALYGIFCDFRDGCKINKNVSIKNNLKEVATCILFMIIISIPALLSSENALWFIFRGLLSSVMSFGGGDAYLTVADGMFVSSGLVSENEFYSMLVPCVNILPGSILCKTLSGVGYYIGLNDTGTVLGGICVAISGFAVSIAASCGVFSIVAGIYEKFGTLNIFILIKRWIRPIVSGLLVNVILSLIVQIKNQSSVFGSALIPIACMVFVFTVDMMLEKKAGMKNGKVAMFSIATGIIICNIVRYFC